VRIHAYVYVCACMRVYVHVHMYVYVHMCVCEYVCLYMYIHARVGIHMHSCRRTFFLFVLSNPFTTCVCITGVFEAPACVGWGHWKGVFSSFSWLALVVDVGGYVFAGVEIGVLSCTFLYICGC